MNKEEFLKSMEILQLDNKLLGQYLGVTTRTVDRWIKDLSKMNKTAKLTIQSWVKLQSAGLPWIGLNVIHKTSDIHKTSNIGRIITNIQKFYDTEINLAIKNVEARDEFKPLNWIIDHRKNLIYIPNIINMYYNNYLMVNQYKVLIPISPGIKLDVPFLIDEAVYVLNKSDLQHNA